LLSIILIASISTNISALYKARHSWATTAKDEGVAISVISESLGHTSEKVTHVYLASFDNNAMSKANKKVIATIHPNKKKKP
jgi:integrase